MQAAIRTTVRLRKDLFDKSRLMALEKGTSMQEVINTTLALGFGKVSDLESSKQAMAKIDKFRISLSDQEINLQNLLKASRSQQK